MWILDTLLIGFIIGIFLIIVWVLWANYIYRWSNVRVSKIITDKVNIAESVVNKNNTVKVEIIEITSEQISVKLKTYDQDNKLIKTKTKTFSVDTECNSVDMDCVSI